MRDDFLNYFDIHGPPKALIKGTMTKREIGRSKSDAAIMDNTTNQTFYTDPMDIEGVHFLTTVTELMNLN